MKSIIITVIIWMTAQTIYAQSTNRFELEIDPIAYALKGYSIHGIYVKNRLRTDLGFFGIRQPEGYSKNKGYTVQSAGVGIKFNYLLNRTETLFAGLGLGYYENNIKKNNSGLTSVHKISSIGIHAGYRLFAFKHSNTIFKNLYVAPWASLDYNRTLNKTAFDQDGYKQAKWSVFPTIHLGYKF